MGPRPAGCARVAAQFVPSADVRPGPDSRSAYPILLVVHDDFLERHELARLLGLGAVDLAKGALAQLSLELVVANAGAAREAVPRALVLQGEDLRRGGGGGRRRRRRRRRAGVVVGRRAHDGGEKRDGIEMGEARTEKGPSFVLLDKEGRIKSDGDRWGSAARDESLDKESWPSQKLTKRIIPLRSPREEKEE